MWNPLIWLLLFGFYSTESVPVEEKPKVDSYGKLIEAQSTTNGKKIAQTDDGIQFEVPSYASGIVVPEPYNDLLPPLTNSEKLEADKDDSKIIHIGNFGGTSNNIRDGKSIGSVHKDYSDSLKANLPIKGKTSVTIEESIEVPYTDLNPPFFDNEKQVSTDNPEVIDNGENTEQAETPLYDGDIYQGGFGGSSGVLGNQESVGIFNQEKNTAAEINSGLTDLIPPLVNKKTVVKIDEPLYNGDVYIGGFGGSTGILGNQESLGTYHQQKNAATDINTDLTPPLQTEAGIIKDFVKNPDDSLYVGDVYKGRFGGPSGILGNQKPVGTYHQQKDTSTDINTTNIPPVPTPLKDGDVYKGGFGGPSGFLGNQKLVGTYHQQKDITTDINTTIIPPLSTTIAKEIEEKPDEVLNDGDVYKGGFGGPSGLLGNQKLVGTYHQQKDASTDINTTIIPPLPTTIDKEIYENPDEALYDGDVYKGAFGGPSGLLGNQKSVGTDQPSKNINTESTVLITPLATIVTKQVVKKPDETLYDGDIYRGRFGGPSGILGNQDEIGTYHQSKIQPSNIESETSNPTSTTGSNPTTNDYRADKNKKTINENTTENININQIKTTTKPKKKIVSRFEFSSLPKPGSNVNVKKDEGKKVTSEIYNGGFGGPSGILGEQKKIGTYHENKNNVGNKENNNSDQATSSTINPPSLDLLPPFEESAGNQESDNSTEKALSVGDIFQSRFGAPPSTPKIPIAVENDHETIKPKKINEATTINPIKSRKNEATTTEINITEKSPEAETQKSPINMKNEDIPPTDLIPPFLDPIAIQETSTTTEKNSANNVKKNSSTTEITHLDEDTQKTERTIENTTLYPADLSTSSVDTEKYIGNNEKNTEKSLYEGDIYKGGFGGRAGFLGDQKNLGTYHKERKHENLNEEKTTARAIVLQDTTEHLNNKQNSTQDFTTASNIRNTKSAQTKSLISDIPLIRVSLNTDAPPEANTKSFLSSSSITTPTLSIHSTTPEPPSIFFSPPFYSPKPEQEQTFLPQNGNIPTINHFSEKPTPAIGQSFGNNQKNEIVSDFVFSQDDKVSPPKPQESNIATNVFNSQEPKIQQVFKNPVVAVRVDIPNESPNPVNQSPINVNSFGNIQGPKSPFLSNIGTISNNKFTGQFGGAPGILGNQKQPGYGVQPENNIPPKPANIPTKPVAATVPIINNNAGISNNFKPATVASNSNKYNGGFGGPPGILQPFDNKPN